MIASRLAHVMIFVKDVPAMARFYQQAFELATEPSGDLGFVVLGAPNRAGGRFCECADPEGNVLQIFERPA